jgi:hypothetical protein
MRNHRADSAQDDALTRSLGSRDEARSLASEGRYIDAIEVLSAANRHRHDVDFEALLVRLRHQAFAEVGRAYPRTPWPPVLPDPFPKVKDYPPEVMRWDLTSDVLGGAVLHHGCLLVRELVREEQVMQLVVDTDRAFEAHRAHSHGAPLSETRPWFVPLDPDPGYARLDDAQRRFHAEAGAVLAGESPRALFEIVEAYEQNHLIDTIEGYLGERPVISLNKCVLRDTRYTRSPAFPTWHQDGAFLGEGVRAVDVWLSLSHCGDGTHAPGLEILPRRVHEILETGQGFQNAVTRKQVEAAAGDTPIIRPLFAPGDALIFDEQFLHRTGSVPGMAAHRQAIETWFFAPSSFPRSYIPIVL